MEHKDKFTEDEEFQLDYTEIHNGYVTILEEKIDAKLLEKFSQEVLDAFYDAFKADHRTFEGTNQEAADQLRDFTDIVKFKETMVALKTEVAA